MINKKEIVILAGGMGSRIQSLSKGMPKCLMKIGEKPFLYHLLLQFIDLGADKIVLAIANKSADIIKFVSQEFSKELSSGKILFSDEKVQSGTGGATQNAVSKIQSEVFLVSNADTIIPNLSTEIWSSLEKNMNFLIFLSEMTGTRFCYFKTDKTYIVDIFKNKTSGKTSSGLILVRKSFIKNIAVKRPFSLENDVLKSQARHRKVGYKMVEGFIDFGVPEDFARASARYRNKEDSIFR
ncbi:sugar phosphate nucleotidyltransferase [Paracoccaceae bacterium]|nr:sugar phosphate nucleotidyltransferase [Paracoccaceae bacterium]